MPPSIIALIVAAGQASRMGGEIPKPYIKLAGLPVLRRTVMAFASHPAISGVRVVIGAEHEALYHSAVHGLALLDPVMGGASRQESVRLGLMSLEAMHPALVLIHDAARPFVSHALISTVIGTLEESRCAVLPAVAVTDTLKRVRDGGVETVDRVDLFAAQTPQGFYFSDILDAHRRYKDLAVTDDVALAERAGIPVVMVPGDPGNRKLTTQDDLARMEAMATQEYETRVGIGFDVHPYKAHDPHKPVVQQNIVLCGVKIPFDYYLVGHSDADAGLHALVDAILGAIGAGDIGLHFPPDDPKWAGADSSRFLLHTYTLMKDRGGEIVNLDLTLICEQPRISKYRDAMVDHIAGLLKIDRGRINVKATTTERLGFIGRREGLAAQAVASVRMPVKP
jgi:2-C-methyl-D-erythritol 4-phosphate cytidylyltransferase/2-C-methyl-D-erythritol 2,4-cyclodiphosphate synthase